MCTQSKLPRLVIISHVRHYLYNGNLYSYGPYSREIDIWADLFPEVWIAAPCHFSEPAGDSLPFGRKNIVVHPVAETGGTTFSSKLHQIALLPKLIWDLAGVIRHGDAVHVRCPGNLGLLGAVIAPVFSKYLVAKYAGQWNDYEGEPFSFRLQKRILASAWFGGPVTVYGDWPRQSKNVVPFFTSILSEEQMERAKRSTTKITFNNPMRIIFVGRLSHSKNVHVLIAALARLKRNNVAFECKIIGDGPMLGELKSQVSENLLADEVVFMGAVPFDDVFNFYEWADVLVLASETEGWPKAIVEGMAFGLLCIGNNRGLVPQLLGAQRGIVVEPGNEVELASTLLRLQNEPDKMIKMRRDAAEWAKKFTLEGLRTEIASLLTQKWGIDIGCVSEKI